MNLKEGSSKEESFEIAIKLRQIQKYVEKFQNPEKFVNKILDSFDNPFYIIDANTHTIKLSNSSTNIKNLSKLTFCYNHIHGTNKKCPSCIKNKFCPIEEIKKTKKSITFTQIQKFQGKKNIFVKIHASPIFNKKGDVVEIIRYELNLQQLKEKSIKIEENKKQINALTNNPYFGICKLDKEGYCKLVNKKFYEIQEITKEQALKKNYLRISPEYVKKLFFQKKPYSFNFPTKDNKTFLFHAHPYFNSKGFDGYFVTIVDTTKLTQAKNEIIEYREKLDRYNLHISSKSKFRSNLNKKEQLCLYGICKYPLASDNELSLNLGLNRSTITAIKNRLKDKKWYKLIYLPNFYSLGANIFSILINQPNITKNQLKKKIILKTIYNSTELIFNHHNQEQSFSFFISQKYSDLKKILDKFHNKELLLNKEIQKLIFTYELDCLSIGCFSSLINKNFNLNFNYFPQEEIINSNLNFQNNTINKRILHSLTKFPELSIEELSKKIWISKPTISKTKKILLNEKLLFPKIIPNLKKLNFNFICLFHCEFEQNLSQKLKEKEKNIIEPSAIFKICSKNHITKCMILKDDYEMDKELSHLKKLYSKEQIPFEMKLTKHKIQNKTFFQKLDFASLTEKLLFS